MEFCFILKLNSKTVADKSTAFLPLLTLNLRDKLARLSTPSILPMDATKKKYRPPSGLKHLTIYRKKKDSNISG